MRISHPTLGAAPFKCSRRSLNSRPGRLELPTSRFEACHSIQLSYGRKDHRRGSRRPRIARPFEHFHFPQGQRGGAGPLPSMPSKVDVIVE